MIPVPATPRKKALNSKKMQRTLIEYGGYLCRRCMDHCYHVHLAHRDVKEIPGTCHRCGKTRKLVIDLKIDGRLKMLGKWDAR